MRPNPIGLLRCRDRTLDYRHRTFLMGILNVTPDSFSDGGRFMEMEPAIERGKELRRLGADILDIGGESSRPGAQPISEADELYRVLPVIEALAAETDAILSIDTYKPSVARVCLQRGVHMVNDITGLNDPAMAHVVAEFDAALCVMHMQGTPRTMQENPRYVHVVKEVAEFLADRASLATRAGVSPEGILIDPGIGFGKTVAHNLEILRELDAFGRIGYPVLVGTSRKRFLGSLTNTPVEGRLFATASSVAVAIARGANGVRVHDVGEMAQVVRVADAIRYGAPESS